MFGWIAQLSVVIARKGGRSSNHQDAPWLLDAPLSRGMTAGSGRATSSKVYALELCDPLFGSIGNNRVRLPAVVLGGGMGAGLSPGVVADGGRSRHTGRAVGPLLEHAQALFERLASERPQVHVDDLGQFGGLGCGEVARRDRSRDARHRF